MDYRPRYAQPFTLEEARQLAVPIITEEISRLQNSLSHLQRTQDELKEALSTTAPDDADADLTAAFEENETVIGSQTERISMLRMVLAEKGLPMSGHYDGVGSSARPNAAPHTQTGQEAPTRADGAGGVASTTNEDEGGVYL